MPWRGFDEDAVDARPGRHRCSRRDQLLERQSAAERSPRTGRPAVAGTTGTVDVNAARERGAEIGEKVAVAAAKMRDSAQEAALTSKIKAKMVLDDTIKARSIDVTTTGTTVTVSGVVRSVNEHDCALSLARDRGRHSGGRSDEGGKPLRVGG